MLAVFKTMKTRSKKVYTLLFLLLCILIIIAIAVFIQWSFYEPNQVFTEFAMLREDEAKDDSRNSEQNPDNPEDIDDLPLIINIVFLGLDTTEQVERFNRQEISDKVHPDTIIFTSLNIRERHIKAISIPRDARVPIINQGVNDKINAAYDYGYRFGSGTDEQTKVAEGIRYTLETIENLVGANIDFYVAIDIDALIRIIDLMGGVYYDVEQDIHADLGQGRVLIEEGYQHLDGEHFFYYIHYRDVYGMHNDRMERQRKIVLSTLQQYRDTGKLSRIPLLMNVIKNSVITNLDTKHMGALVRFATELDMDAIEFYYFDGEGIFTDYGFYFYIDEEQRALMLKEVLGVEVESMGITKGVPTDFDQVEDDFDLEAFKKEFWQDHSNMMEQDLYPD